MTKPLPTGSIKRKKIPTMREFNLIIQGILDEDKAGPLFVVDIHFDKKNASEEQFSANERSVFSMRLNDTGKINSFKTTVKTHATMGEKMSILLYAEHLHFLLMRYIGGE